MFNDIDVSMNFATFGNKEMYFEPYNDGIHSA